MLALLRLSFEVLGRPLVDLGGPEYADWLVLAVAIEIELRRLFASS